jgi:nickel import ATP-binding protein nikE
MSQSLAKDILEIKNLCVSAGQTQLVRGLNLRLASGRITALVGKSGSGKTLSALTLQGFTPPGLSSSADIFLNGRRLDVAVRRGKIFASVMQNPKSAFNPLLSIGAHAKETADAANSSRNLAPGAGFFKAMGLGLKRAKAAFKNQPASAQSQIKLAMRAVGLEEGALKLYPHEMSGGMLQRAMIALALLSGAKFIVADEPTTDLDLVSQAKILTLLRDAARQTGAGVLLITHDLSVVAKLADDIYVMERGELAQSGDTREIFSAPTLGATRELLRAHFALYAGMTGEFSRQKTANEAKFIKPGAYDLRTFIAQVAQDSEPGSSKLKFSEDKFTQANEPKEPEQIYVVGGLPSVAEAKFHAPSEPQGDDLKEGCKDEKRLCAEASDPNAKTNPKTNTQTGAPKNEQDAQNSDENKIAQNDKDMQNRTLSPENRQKTASVSANDDLPSQDAPIFKFNDEAGFFGLKSQAAELNLNAQDEHVSYDGGYIFSFGEDNLLERGKDINGIDDEKTSLGVKNKVDKSAMNLTKNQAVWAKAHASLMDKNAENSPTQTQNQTASAQEVVSKIALDEAVSAAYGQTRQDRVWPNAEENTRDSKLPLLKACGIGCGFENVSFLGKRTRKDVLRGVSFEIRQGEALGLLGKSGCGKSTLAKVLTGLLHPSEGWVEFDGRRLNLTDLDAKREFYSQAQIVFQDAPSAVNPRLSVREVIEEPLLYLTRMPAAQRLERIRRLLKTLEIDESFLNKKASLLSGGQLSRVTIARALAAEPRLVVLDEALSSLDAPLQTSILRVLERLKGKISFLFITHDIRLARIFCDRIVLMDEGRIAQTATAFQSFTCAAGKELESAVLPPFPSF